MQERSAAVAGGTNTTNPDSFTGNGTAAEDVRANTARTLEPSMSKPNSHDSNSVTNESINDGPPGRS